jgi:ABC-type sugar transport system ATPase subunit
MQKQVVLEVKDISKSFPGVQALNKVSLDLNLGEVHAICGENGAGKSTLMQILAGVYNQESGSIFMDGKEVKIENQYRANQLGISIVYQERSLVPGLSIAENIYADRQPINKLHRINRHLMNKNAAELLDTLQIKLDPRTLVGNLSSPMQQLVEIAKALSHNPRVLIFDEPTATITEREVSTLFKLIRSLKTKGISMLYISHRLSEIFEIADRVSVLKDGKYMGTENVANIDQKWVVNKMVGRDVYFTRKANNVSDEVVLECKNFNDGFHFKNVSFYLKRGEILSFSGMAGAGRTELFQNVYGVQGKPKGTVLVNGKKVKIRSCSDAIKIGIGYLTEDRKHDGLFLNMDLSENIVSASLEMFQKGILQLMMDKKMYTVSRDYIKKLNIITPSVKQTLVNLSGGNQQKVVLAKWMLANPNILIVDEPTRGVDVGAKEEIYAMLRNLTSMGKSIIVISSDLPEVITISDRVYTMYNGTITGELTEDDIEEKTIMHYASGLADVCKVGGQVNG